MDKPLETPPVAAPKNGLALALGRLQSVPTEVYGLLTLVALLLLPTFVSEFQTQLASDMLIIGLFALSLNIILGYGGMVHFGHAAFYGVGAYTVAILIWRYKVDPLLAMLAAPFMSALFGVVIGWFCVRRVRLYFAILTLAFGQLLYIIVFRWYEFTNGDNGIHGLQRPEFLRDTNSFYFFTVVVVGLCYVAMRILVNSPFVLILRATRENAERAQFIGVDVRRHQLATFVVGAFFAGVAGALMAQEKRFAAVEMLFWTTSSEPLLGALMGGMFSLPGPVIGGALLAYLNVTITRYTTYWPLVLGILTILIVLAAPDGLYGLAQRLWRRAQGKE
jgi:branched-chain amino acid transport system permease protein